MKILKNWMPMKAKVIQPRLADVVAFVATTGYLLVHIPMLYLPVGILVGQ
jgi:hypothetical protein